MFDMVPVLDNKLSIIKKNRENYTVLVIIKGKLTEN